MTSGVVPGVAGAVEDFDSFYQAHFGNTVKMAYGLTADLPEAHDIAQEAFCRAWSRWRDLSGFDNPAAWVRKVAVNLARSRWRRLRTQRLSGHLVRERPEHVAALDPEHVAVVAALRKLPAAQREAIVLHYLVDLPLAEVAEQMRAPVGTVKSWLHRGRTALAEELRIDFREAVVPPGAEQVFKTVKNRSRVRTTAALLLVVMLVIGVVALSRFAQGSPEPIPIDSPTPAPSSTVDDPMAAVDWTRTTLDFRVTTTGCPSGWAKFAAADGGASTSKDRSTYPAATLWPEKVAVGDLDGDGLAEAAVSMFCRRSPESDDVPEQLLVVKRAADGSLATVAISDVRRNLTLTAWILDGVIYMDSIPRDSVGGRRTPGQVEAFRMDGTVLRAVDPADRYPPINVLNLSDIASRLPCRPRTSDLSPSFDKNLRATAGGLRFSLSDGELPRVYASFGRNGRPYLVLELGCGEASAEQTRNVILIDQVDGRWRAVDVLPDQRLREVRDDQTIITQPLGAKAPVSWTWDGRAFSRKE
ncbi:MAG TPA: SigE family RNA polymerase sigma factor [Candidatus Limnocylindrales bacterium]|nr:SigE family RNA polymerase sigma factor [Candidatus Limnocylindrales bacterium]